MLERNRSQSIEVPSASADGPAAPTSVHALREAKVCHADRSGHRVATASPAAVAAGGRVGLVQLAKAGRGSWHASPQRDGWVGGVGVCVARSC
jgi:hypothetical protein